MVTDGGTITINFLDINMIRILRCNDPFSGVETGEDARDEDKLRLMWAGGERREDQVITIDQRETLSAALTGGQTSSQYQ